MKAYNLLVWCGAVVLALLQACAAPSVQGDAAGTPAAQPARVKAGRAPIPGGDLMYAFGDGQSPENFKNVAIAQYDYALWPGRHWATMGPYTLYATGNRGALQLYYPLHVRWKLKDGREFILEDIDVAAIMREYFKTHSLQLQWQREGRVRDLGDSGPLLAHEVKDDTVILKWMIDINRTPVEKRFPQGRGVPPPWDIVQETHIVAILPGKPTSGIDFTKRREQR